MQARYRGHLLEAKRERCLARYSLLYWSIFRIADDFECASGCEDSGETTQSMLEHMRQRVGAELLEADPWLESTL